MPRAIIRLGKALDLTLVGEQVEIEEQARVLRDLGTPDPAEADNYPLQAIPTTASRT